MPLNGYSLEDGFPEASKWFEKADDDIIKRYDSKTTDNNAEGPKFGDSDREGILYHHLIRSVDPDKFDTMLFENSPLFNAALGNGMAIDTDLGQRAYIKYSRAIGEDAVKQYFDDDAEVSGKYRLRDVELPSDPALTTLAAKDNDVDVFFMGSLPWEIHFRMDKMRGENPDYPGLIDKAVGYDDIIDYLHDMTDELLMELRDHATEIPADEEQSHVKTVFDIAEQLEGTTAVVTHSRKAYDEWRRRDRENLVFTPSMAYHILES